MNGRIAALAGRVPELTAEQLDRMDAVALAALYSSGVRLLTVKNNDTITLHSIDSAGALTWLDTNMPRENLLDNPDYSIAQVEHGGTHGTISYAADRWRNGGATISYADGVLTAANAEEIDYCYILQFLENRDIKGKRVTLAVEADGELLVYAATWPTEDNSSISSPFFSNGMRLRAAVSSLGVPAFILVLPQYDSTPVALKNARLYYGAYNVITLPPWKEPDLTIERSKCTDYLTRSSAAARYAGNGGDTTSKVRVYIPIGKRMRANPKVYPSSGISISVRVQTGAYNDTNATINNVTIDNFGLLLEITGSRQIINSPYANCTVIINTPLLFSSDL